MTRRRKHRQPNRDCSAASNYGFTQAANGALPTKAAFQQINTTAVGTGTGFYAWTAGDFHQKTGNLGIADGSVQSASQSGLRTYMLNSTNTVAAPALNFPM